MPASWPASGTADQIEGLSRQHSLAFETLSQVIGMIQPDSVMGPL